MPQLMPLSWLFSNFFIITFLFTIVLLYSLSSCHFCKSSLKNSNNLFFWCW
uniref:ATP synthase F0 subunit 8 n=1 Tax=Linyphia triangularis TaxID=94031 RepID=A0A7L7S193_LINTI|nr:ATP synthase F0 subunit 8 [Linyphia triangularis]